MTDDEIKQILATIEAQAAPKTMLDELTESQRKIVLATLHGVEKLMEKREVKTRSFWRAVFDAVWSMLSHGHALLQKLFKE